jgi:NitT/TauT family transport system permease protein
VTLALQRPTASPGARFLSHRGVRGVIGFVVLFLVLEAITRAGLVNESYLPPLSLILQRAVGLLVDATFLQAVGATLLAAAVGLVLSILVAVPAGVLLGSSNRAYTATRALVEFLRPIPSVALIPLAILLFGQQLEMKVFLIVYSTFWPLLFNTVYGVHDVDPVAKDTARTYGYGRLATLARVSLPSSLPFVYTGIRISVSIALIVAISAELLAGGDSGIGSYILVVGQSAGRHDLVYAATILAGAIGWLANWLLVRGEQRLFAWHAEIREGTGE